MRQQKNKYKMLSRLMSAGGLTILFSVAFLLSSCTSTWRAPVASAPSYRPAKAFVASGHYVVQPGDTLYSIAWKTGTDYLQLAAWNGIRPPYIIYKGQSLRLTRPAYRPAVHKPKKAKNQIANNVRKPVKQVKPVTKKPLAKTQYKNDLAWRWPTRGKIIQVFKKSDDTRKGIQLAGKYGQAIKASESGKVVYSGSGLIGYGKLIIIKHNKKYLSAYGFNSELLVKEGDQVKRGMQIAKMGFAKKGRAVLHFEVRKNGNPVNPLALLP